MPVFTLEDHEAWPDDGPDPVGEVSADAANVPSWMRPRMEISQSSTPILWLTTRHHSANVLKHRKVASVK